MSSLQVGSPALSPHLLSISGASTSDSEEMTSTSWTSDSEPSTQPSTKQRRRSEGSGAQKATFRMAVSSATPCLSEATGGAETHCPEVTRPVGEPHMLCPTIYDRDDGQRQDIVFPSIISGMCSLPRSQIWPNKSESRGIIPSRHYVDSNEGRVLSSDEVYIGFVRTVKEYKGFTRISAHRPQSHLQWVSMGQ